MKVKRYNLTNSYDSGMEKSSDGKFVRYEDYKWMSDYADRLVEHKDMVCLPSDLKNLRDSNAVLAQENFEMKQLLKQLLKK
jgi:hypothetical protein